MQWREPVMLMLLLQETYLHYEEIMSEERDAEFIWRI